MKRQTYFVTLDGVTKSLAEWALETGQDVATLRDRHKKRWSAFEIINGRDRVNLVRDPTPEEIKERCAEIRAEWPPERFNRYAGRPVEITRCAAHGGIDQTSEWS